MNKTVQKNKLYLIISICLVLLSSITGADSFPCQNKEFPHKSIMVSASQDDLLGRYEKSNRKFIRTEIGDKIVYHHLRKIDKAVVEKDFIVYQFNRYTREFIKKIENWREGLPEHINISVSKQEAALKAKGDILSTKLYIISPESDIFLLDPVPENPCWIIKSIKDSRMIITVIDAVNGILLGYGISPPYDSVSMSGPYKKNPCRDSWTSWYESAEFWFNKMGYPAHAIEWPTKAEIRNFLQDPRIKLFYEIAHGSSSQFGGTCRNGRIIFTTAKEIEKWISSYPKKAFVFIGSCKGMDKIGDNSLSYEFRKGSSENTTTTGYWDIKREKCDSCWTNSVDWQEQFFFYICHGNSVKEAFDLSLADYPMCTDCVRFAGDEDYIIEKRIYAPLFVSAEQVKNRSLLQMEYINVLKWKANSLNYEVDNYRIYEIKGDSWDLIADIPPDTFKYQHRNVKENKKYLYGLVAIICNTESPAIYIEINN